VNEWQIAAVEGVAGLMFMLTGSRWLLIDQCLARKWPRGLRILNLSYHSKVMGIGSQSLFLSFIIVTGVTMAPY
jgi:hypothetical protein